MTRRFYAAATAAKQEDGHAILLDGRPVRTPAKAPLRLPSANLAAAIAAEWAAQGETVRPESMPLTGLANAAIDLVLPDPAAFAAPLAQYGESDLLYYRGEDPALVARQAEQWNPILAWAERRYGVEFTIVQGIMFAPQPVETLARLNEALAALSPFRLAAMAPFVTIGGSLVCALALESNAFAPEALWSAVNLDELWQEERWGPDTEAIAVRERRAADWSSAARFLSLL